MVNLLCLTGYLLLLITNPAPLIASPPISESVLFERAVACIKHFEGWHTAKNYPYIGWGHKLLPGEKLDTNLTKEQGDSLLREDLRKRYIVFRKYGKDALLLTVLSYNVGQNCLLGYGKIPKSNLIEKLERGDRDIYREYISFRKYKGKVVRSIERRRKHEFVLLYIP